MKGSSIYRVALNLFKQAGASFLVFIMLLMQIPDAFWQELHTHEHHDCGLPNVVHEYTPDCTLEQRFVQPWNHPVKPLLKWISNPFFILIESKNNSSFSSSLSTIHRNKAPPGRMIQMNPTIHLLFS